MTCIGELANTMKTLLNQLDSQENITAATLFTGKDLIE